MRTDFKKESEVDNELRNRIIALLMASAFFLSPSGALANYVAEYTIGPTTQNIDLGDFNLPVEDIGSYKSAYREINFTECDEINGAVKEDINIGGLVPGAWVRFNGIDFGTNENQTTLSMEIARGAGCHNGILRVYLLEKDKEITVDQDGCVPPDEKQLVWYRFTNDDMTADWSVPKTFNFKISENISGTYDLLVTFGNVYGLGNFYNLSFTRAGSPVYENNSLKLDSGVEAPFDIYPEFIADEISVEYNCTANTSAVIKIDGDTYSNTFSSGNNELRITPKKDLLPGDHVLKISADGKVNITAIKLNKKKADSAQPVLKDNPEDYPVTGYSDFSELIRSAVILKNNSPVYFVNGSKRYIDYDDAYKMPYTEDGVIYIPAEAFSQMTGAYYEETENYLRIKGEEDEICLSNGNLSLTDSGKIDKNSGNDLKQISGEYYLPAKKYLEVFGYTTFEKDGIIVGDNKARIKRLKDDLNFSLISEYYAGEVQKTGTTYYVSKSGASGDGSRENPFGSIGEAANVAQAGDTVIISGGVYRETLKPKNSGDARNPIVFRAAEGEEVLISALEPLGNTFTLEKTTRVYSKTPPFTSGRNQVFINGEASREARYPDTSDTYRQQMFSGLSLSSLWPTTGTFRIDGESAYSKGLVGSASNAWSGATFVSFHGSGWSIGTAKITSSQGANVYFGDKTETWWFGTSEEETDYSYITGAKAALNLPGEWYADSTNKKIYVRPYSEDDEIEIKQRMLCVDLTDKSCIQLQGINTKGGGISLSGSNMCVINGGEHKYISHYTYSDDQHYAFIEDGNVFDLDGAPRRGEMGVYIGGSDNAILNTSIKHSAAAGLYVTGKHAFIYNNLIEETGYMGSYASGIFITADAATQDICDERGGHAVYHNTVDKTGRAALAFAGIEDDTWFSEQGITPYMASDIAYNVFKNACLLSRDGGVLYFHGSATGDEYQKTKVRNNIISDGRSIDARCEGIYLDNYVQQMMIYENIICATSGSQDVHLAASLYIQPQTGAFSTSFANGDAWNNKIFQTVKPEFTEGDYPDGPYLPGVRRENIKYVPADAVKYESGGMTVDFSDKYDALEIFYKADCENSSGKIKVNIGGEYRQAEIKSGAVINDYIASVKVMTGTCSGVNNVSIEKTGGDDIEILYVRPIKVSEEEKEILEVLGKTYGGDYSTASSRINKKKGPDGEHMLAYDTITGNYMIYPEVYLPESADAFVVSYATDDIYGGQTFEVRYNSADGEVICTGTTEKVDRYWENYTPVVIKLSKPVAAGTHTICVKFTGATNKTCNFNWFGFANTSDLTIDAYSDSLDTQNIGNIKNAVLDYSGVRVNENSELVYEFVDFGGSNDAKLTVEYEKLGTDDILMHVETDNSGDIAIYNPNLNSDAGKTDILLGSKISGVRKVRITFSGSGEAIVKSLSFKQTMFEALGLECLNNAVSMILRTEPEKNIAVGVFDTNGGLKSVKLYTSDENGEVIIENVQADGNVFKTMFWEDMQTLKPFDEAIHLGL